MSYPVWMQSHLHRLQWLRTAQSNPRLYSHTGMLLLWLALPVSTLDIMIAPEFFAPHPECNGRADAVFSLILGALPWAVISFFAVSMVTVPATDQRRGGADIFDLSLGKAPWNMAISLPVFGLIAYFAVHLLDLLWWFGSAQKVTGDCGGKAEPMTFSVTAPSIQFMPFLEAAICVWLLHIRALALSPKVRPGAKP